MNTTRRVILSGAIVAVGAISAALPATDAMSAETNCAPGSCDPFPNFGDKAKISRSEFNEIASSAINNIIDSMKSDSQSNLKDSDIDLIKKNIYYSMEQMVIKYRDIEP